MHLGIDIGTSSIKSILGNAQGEVVASHSFALDVQRPEPSYSEQNPEQWWHGVETTIRAIKQQASTALSQVKSIGLSGQMHGLVALDKAHQVIRPAILWNDTRSHRQAAKLDKNTPAFRAEGGNIVMPGFTAPKFVWMAENEPENAAKTALILLPKDYIRLRMSGEAVSDLSDASGTLWVDIVKRNWSDTLLGACGLSIAQMPRLEESWQGSTFLRRDIADSWGIDGQPVIAGAGDNAAAACGLGITNNQDSFISLGTSGVVFTATNAPSPNPGKAVHTFCHALPERWHQMGVILAATDCLNWFSEITNTPVQEMMQQVENSHITASEVLFHPYLSGERTPHNNAHASAGFFGLRRGHSQQDMLTGILQGVGFALYDSIQVLGLAKGHHFLVTGGGAHSQAWLQMIADLSGCHLSRPV